VTGLNAINAANGWAMAFAGITIVLSGLTVLATIISQLHKIVGWLERSKEAAPAAAEKKSDTQRALAIPEHLHDDIDAVASIYKALTQDLPSPFELTQLHAIGAENKLPHVHLSLRSLREAGHLDFEGEGRFTWKS
jgi:hypothetical protein